MPDTRTDLVEELEHLLAHAKPGATKRKLVEGILERARRGEYHDFKSPHAAPKLLLVEHLREASLGRMAQRVVGGEWDEKPDSEDLAQMAETLRREPQLRHRLQLPDPPAASSVRQTVPGATFEEENLDERALRVFLTEGYEVAAWSPGRAGEKVAPTQVHVLLPFKFGGRQASVAMRLKSARALDELVGTLLEYRKAVWGAGSSS